MACIINLVIKDITSWLKYFMRKELNISFLRDLKIESLYIFICSYMVFTIILTILTYMSIL